MSEKYISLNNLKEYNTKMKETYVEPLETKIETVESIAKGANPAKTFETYSDMIEEIRTYARADFLNVGQNIMIVALEVPDLWISSTTENYLDYSYTSDEDFVNLLKTNGSVQIGHYFVSALETQKVELTDYVKFTDYASTTTYGTMLVGEGLSTSQAGKVNIRFATPAEIEAKTSSYKPIVPSYIDYTFKVSATTNTETWTDDEKKSARDLIGAVGDTDYATQTKAGVAMPGSGLTIGEGGRLYVRCADKLQISERTSHYFPITPAFLDYATMSALSDCKEPELWTDDTTDENGEVIKGTKTKACELLGAVDTASEQVITGQKVFRNLMVTNREYEDYDENGIHFSTDDVGYSGEISIDSDVGNPTSYGVHGISYNSEFIDFGELINLLNSGGESESGLTVDDLTACLTAGDGTVTNIVLGEYNGYTSYLGSDSMNIYYYIEGGYEQNTTYGDGYIKYYERDSSLGEDDEILADVTLRFPAESGTLATQEYVLNAIGHSVADIEQQIEWLDDKVTGLTPSSGATTFENLAVTNISASGKVTAGSLKVGTINNVESEIVALAAALSNCVTERDLDSFATDVVAINYITKQDAVTKTELNNYKNTVTATYATKEDVNNALAGLDFTSGDLNVSGSISASEKIFANGGISCTGGLIVNGIVSADNFYATSDNRLKENIVEYQPKASILDLPVVEYNFISRPDEKEIGCIAQDLQQLFPELVSENENGYLSIKESKLVYLLLNEVKELKKEINELKSQIGG